MKLKQPKKKDQFKNQIVDPTKLLLDDNDKNEKAPLNLSVHKKIRKAFIVLVAKKDSANNKLFTEIFLDYIKRNNLSIDDLCS